ncbi:tetratricopeptide (TPR) repeat protein [Lysobacter enzymogenes]|uniref:DUF4365 domain-containing protein n=1 Tax=Lysobacter enzymogenes TaxID=69 RepID=UPI003396C5CE
MNYSDEQRIGDLGAKAFEGGRPDSWIKEGEPRQGGDFGFDYSMHVEESGNIQGRFSVQVKSGLQIAPKGEGDSQYFSVQIERATCNRYIQDGQPVMLVFANLSDLSSRNATLYYLWIEEQIRERLKGKLRFDEDDAAKPTFRVPISNVLEYCTDIAEHLRQHWNFNLTSNRLRGIPDGIPLMENLSKLSPAGVAGLTRTNPVSLDVWVRNESLSGDRPWAAPTPNSPAGRLKQASEDISAGKLADAERELDKLAADDGLIDELRAETHFQLGRLKTIAGTPNEAFEYYRTATTLQPKNTRYIAAKIEMAVSSRADDEPVDLSFVASIDSEAANDQGVLFQLVRVAKINEDHALAAQLLERLEEPERSKAVALQALIEGDWPTVITVADKQAPLQPNANDRFFLNLLRHRAELHTLLRGAESYSIGGPIDIDIELAKSFRDLTLSLLHEAKSRHWPPNSTLLLDGANVVASVFGANGEVADLIQEFATARPNNQGAQEAAARTAALGDRPDDAIAALERMGAHKGDDSARLVLVLCESGRHLDGARKAFGLIDKWEYTELTSAAAAIASLSARRVGLVTEAKALDTFVAKSSDYPGVKVLAEFVRKIHDSPEDAESHVQNLLAVCDKEPLLQDNLMLHLSANREDHSKSIVDVCSKIMLRRGLAEMEHAKYLAALYTLGRHGDVIVASELAIARFPANETIALCRALSLDLKGQLQAADMTLRRIASPARLDLLDTHSRLLIRLGEQDAAVSLVQRALERAQRRERFQLLQLLSLLQSQNHPEVYLETVWQLGQAADREDEDQEAIFLISFAIAAARSPDVPIAWQVEFDERAERFTESYPDSSAFRIGRLDSSDRASAIHELRQLSGETEQIQALRNRQRRFGEAMGSNVPYSYRPRTFAPLARNVADLAAFTMHGRDTSEWARLAFHIDGSSEDLPSAPPILDLITFLSLVELDLLEVAIKVWSCIALPKISAFALASMKFEPIVPKDAERLDRAMNALRTHRGAIIQPTITGHTGAPPCEDEYDVIAHEVDAGNFCFLTIDAAAAAHVTAQHGLGEQTVISVAALLRRAEALGVMDKSEGQVTRLRIATWNCRGAPVTASDVAAGCLPSPPSGSDANARAVRAFVSAPDLNKSAAKLAEVVIELLALKPPDVVDRLTWLLDIYFREQLLLELPLHPRLVTTFVAVIVASKMPAGHHELDDMRQFWQALLSVSDELTGASPREEFAAFVGEKTAVLLARLGRRGLAFVAAESRIRELIFSFLTTGTSERAIAEQHYFAETTRMVAAPHQ